MSREPVRGHDRVFRAFDHVISRGRLAHSYLFVGPEGVGKKMFAAELAAALLCEAAPPGSPPTRACGRCPGCLLAAAGTHPDLFIVGRPEEGNEVPIEVMRELCRHFALKPARGRGKAAILDDADDLNDASANCFLKTLEEPPPRSVFFLIGTTRDRQMPTILSRCQAVRFAPLPDDTVAEILRAHGVDQESIARLVRLAGGSPGQALALADPGLWEFRAALLADLARRPLDPVALTRRWMEYAEGAGKELALQRRRAARVLRLLVEFLGDALAHATGGPPRFADPGEARLLGDFAAGRTPERLMGLIDRCLEAEAQVGRYIQLVLVVEGLVDAFCD